MQILIYLKLQQELIIQQKIFLTNLEKIEVLGNYQKVLMALHLFPVLNRFQIFQI